MPERAALGRVIAGAVVAAILASRPVASDVPIDTPPELRRRPDNTYLTFPEWFLVHSPAEYATYTHDHSPSGFPFLGHVGQLWSSYGAVIDATADYELNAGYHMMILVIATSTTVEYGIRRVYETLIGRLAEATQLGETTAEERFGAQVAQEYVDLINVRPWYEFDFLHALTRLWTEVPILGPDLPRKLERRYVLTSEYLAKAAYAWLIGLGTDATYEPESERTAVVVEGLPEDTRGIDVEILERLEGGAVLATLPRYQAFTDHATRVGLAGARFREIAGNRGPILVSLIKPVDRSFEEAGISVDAPLFVQPILTRPEEHRVVFEVPVAQLAEVLRRLAQRGFTVEHVYDY